MHVCGRRPDTTRVWEFTDHFREKSVAAKWTSLPQFFKKHGYFVLGGGKLHHPASVSWSPEYPHFPNQPSNGAYKCLNPSIGHMGPGSGTWCTQNSTANLPFFVGCGFHKPHVPDVCVGGG